MKIAFSDKSFIHIIITIVISIIGLVELVSAARHFTHSKQEVELAKVVRIPQRQCRRKEVPIFVHSAARSIGKYYDRRQVTRHTWAKEAIRNNIRVIFVIGVPNDRKTQLELEREARKYNDILQFGFNDNYYNLTLKAIGILRWSYRNCLTSDIIVKTDDDVVVNINRLKRWVDNKAFRSGITGRIMNVRSNRRIGHKWHMPPQYYPKEYYQFMWGFSYILSTDVIKRMYDTVLNYGGPVLDIDDLFMTGIIAEKARIRRHNSINFDGYCGRNACLMDKMFAIHGCETAARTLQLYRNWKKTCHSRLRSQKIIASNQTNVHVDYDVE